MANLGIRNRDEFKQKIINYITHGGLVGVVLSDEDIDLQIDLAKQWFYRNYYYATQDSFLYIPKSVFDDPKFRETRRLKFESPKCIVAITSLKEIKQNLWYSANIPIVGSLAIGGLQLPYLASILSYVGTINSFLGNTVRYSWNDNTQELTVHSDPQFDVVAHAWIGIDEVDLFNDQLFFEYVALVVKIRFYETIKVVDIPLPGNIKINADTSISESKERLKEIKEEIRARSIPAFVIRSDSYFL